ncbi:hypothetical protein GMORB2_3643 [Geosmithia morbida]|uniref:Uncharacterized protein n=1 Tax=Geosmithia morbida TaxID=1094350 RepID=A0A9P5D7S3_9HYPO|nr:uncharacterized protein GMORB2_3643 [Geosmithia morbida]KAF4124804.1 hypothetical protein GMORB2_3643 [Geosmithia morbida]
MPLLPRLVERFASTEQDLSESNELRAIYAYEKIVGVLVAAFPHRDITRYMKVLIQGALNFYEDPSVGIDIGEVLFHMFHDLHHSLKLCMHPRPEPNTLPTMTGIIIWRTTLEGFLVELDRWDFGPVYKFYSFLCMVNNVNLAGTTYYLPYVPAKERGTTCPDAAKRGAQCFELVDSPASAAFTGA